MNDQVIAVSPAEAGRRLSVSTRTVFNLIRRGELPAKKIGSRTVIRVQDLLGFLERTNPAQGNTRPAPEIMQK
jgi:excisionase family DNA binding protein